ncbi:MAG TPA: hypothetical protein DDZ89_11030, partial [Clostridiales bacterium]|nr:hypothetical protein [Clostridiales bacterium]
MLIKEIATLNQSNFHVLSDEELLIETPEMDLSAGFVSPDVLRLIARKKGAKQEETFVLNQKPEWIKIQPRIDGEKVILSTSLVQVSVDMQTLQFKAYNQQGALLVSSKEAPWTHSTRGITLSLELDPKEKIYGLGQDPMANLDQNGHERRMWNATDRKRKSGNNGIPFYTSSKPYGFLLNSSYPSRFAVGKATVAQPPELRIDEKCQEKNPFPWPWNQPNPFSSPDDLSVLLDSDRFECFFVFKDSFDDIQKGYGWLTGTPPMPPMWAFGFIQSKNRYRSMEELKAIADKYRKKNVPLNCLVIDWLWFKEFGDYEWNKAHWPDPEKGIQYLNDLGIQVMQAQHPYIDRESLQYQSLLQKGFLNHVPAHARPTFDFSNPQAQAYYWDRLVKKLYQIGIRGFWTDMGEPEDHPLGTNSYIGSRERLHNIYASLWSQAIYEGQRRDFDERVYILSRAAYAGIQRNGVTLWSNDISASWEVLKDQVVVGQTVALSGQPYWCTDIGGFVTGREFSPELIIRWYQWGVFCPIFRTHGTRADNEVWSFGPEAEKIISSYIKLRTRLLPYIYSCAHMITKQAKPMMRGMCMDFPHDKIAVSQQSQYMFGPCFLVAPVTEPGCRSRKVYLPQGLWYDFWTNETYEGEQWLDVFAPLEQIPLFVKAGSIIPMAKSLFQTGDMRGDQPDLHVYPGQEGQFDFYEDDGKTYGYEKGEYGLTEITMDKTGNVSMHTKHESGIYPKRDRQFYIVYPEKASTKIEYFVDAD